ncbi:MAG: DUF4350 domain-containing protein [Moraxella sp.]|nr:DUF4350 domain-containing protein [Moraxella sp.]
MTKSQRWWLVGGVLVIVVVALMMGWYANTRQKVTYTQYQAVSKSSKNPYYAAMLLLEEDKSVTYLQGLPADEQMQLLWQTPEDAGQHMVMLNDAQAVTDVPQILAWVRAGGHLVVYSDYIMYPDTLGNVDDATLADYAENENPIITALGVRHLSLPMTDRVERGLQSQLDYSYTPIKLPTGELIVVNGHQESWLDDSQVYQIHPDARPVADYRVVWKDMSAADIKTNLAELDISQRQALTTFVNANPTYFQPNQIMIDMYLAEGRVTVISDPKLFTNPYIDNESAKTAAITSKPASPKASSRLWQLLSDNGIGRYESNLLKGKGVFYDNIAQADNAYLLTYLSEQKEHLWFIAQADKPNLLALIWRYTPWFLVALVVALVAILLSLPRQFGRVQTYQDDSAQNLLTYLSSTAEYLWVSDEHRAQVMLNRQRLLEKIRARLPSVLHLDEKASCQYIADDCGITPVQVYQALYATWQSEAEFLRVTQAFAELSRYYDKASRL